MEGAVWGDEDVAAQVDGDGVGGFGFWVFGIFGVCRCCGGRGGGGGGGGGRRRGLLADEVAADHDVVLDDGFAGEHDVWRAVEEGAAGNAVAAVLRRGVSAGQLERVEGGTWFMNGRRGSIQSRCIRRERRFWAAW